MSSFNFNIRTAFASVVNALRQTDDVLTLTDNTDNTYTFTTNATFDIVANDAIQFTNVTGFTDKYLVVSVVSDTSITFEATSGIAIPALTTATYQNCNPSFYYGFIDYLNQTVRKASPKKQINFKNMPAVLLVEPVQWQITPQQSNVFTQGYQQLVYSNVTLLFCKEVPTDWNDRYGSAWYETNIYDPMRQLATDFLYVLQQAYNNQVVQVGFDGVLVGEEFAKLNQLSDYDALLGGVKLTFNLLVQNGVTICSDSAVLALSNFNSYLLIS